MHQSYSNQAPLTQPQMNQPQAIQSKPVATSPTPETGLLHCPVQICPKRDHCYKSYTTLSNHVNWHCKFLDDPDHHVPETFFAESGHRFCITCRAIVCPNPRTHQNHVFTDSIPFPSNLLQDKSPDPTVTCLADGDMPCFDEILENAQNTTRHIPRSCRVKFAKALSQICDKILHLLQEEEGYKLLLMLPTCCLRSPARSGQRKQIAIAKWHEKLLKRWLDGDIHGLWAESKEKTKHQRNKTPMPDTQKRNIERAILMAKEGNLGKAVQCLQSLGMAETNERTLDQLIEKHPTGKVVTSKKLHPKNAALKASPECVLKEIASFAAGSSPGHSSLRFEHLREAFNCSVPLVAQNCLDSFTSVVNIFLSGSAASAASKYVCGAKFIALNKNSDTIRPIAVGEIIRRIVSKVACSSVLSDASKLLVPHQVGVGVPPACESVIHSVRDFIKANNHRDDMAMLKIDFTNAFNLVDRQTFINEVKMILPSIYNWQTH